jgi:hypothetical protein
MTRSKHPKTIASERNRIDQRADPGIGASKGAFMTGEDPRQIEGESTFEGDVENDTTREGGVDPKKLGRTNK